MGGSDLIAENLTDAVEDQDIRMRDLAKRTGISKDRLRQYMDGERRPSSPAIQVLETVLDTDLEVGENA